MCGNALEKTKDHYRCENLSFVDGTVARLTYKMILHTLKANYTEQGDSDLVVKDEYEVSMIFKFLAIIVRRGLTACSDLLFHQSV